MNIQGGLLFLKSTLNVLDSLGLLVPERVEFSEFLNKRLLMSKLLLLILLTK